MKQLNQIRLPFILLLIIIIVFIVLLIINHSELLDNDRNYSFQEAIQKQTDSSVLNTVDRDGEFVNANSREIERAMRITRDDNKFKYMDISQQVPMSKQEVKKMLRGNGILENQADAFIEAQDKYQVNIIYLISHARVETANGNSKLASGIKEGNNRYYNFFGVGAFDESAIHTGKSYAKEASWTSPRKAIFGGAKFIRTNYFDNDQITLYQMRWNPKSPGQHQYASDILWADKIAKYMQAYYDQFGIKKDDVRKNFYAS